MNKYELFINVVVNKANILPQEAEFLLREDKPQQYAYK